MSSWSFEWSFAGHTGTSPDVDPTTDEELDLLGSRLAERRVRLSISLGLDVAALVEAGHPLTTATGTLFLGTDRYIHGTWSEVSYGATGEEISLTITENAGGNGVIFPPGFSTVPRSSTKLGADGETAYDVLPWEAIPAVTGDTQADYDAQAEGKTYPFVFGSPGSSTVPGSTGIMIEDTIAGGAATKIMISGQPVPSGTSEVTLWGPRYDGSTGLDTTQMASEVRSVLHEEDDAGRRIAYVTVNAGSAGDVGRDPNAPYYVSWTAGAATADSPSETLAHLMMLAGVRVDVGAVRALSGLLDRYLLSWYTDKSSDLWEMIRRGLLPVLPVAWVPRRHGYTPIPLPTLEHPPAFSVTDGEGFHRDAAIRYEPGDVENRIEIEYGYRPDEKTYSGRVVIAANHWPDGAESEVTHGTRSAKPIKLDCVWDADTATAVGRDRLALKAKPWRRVSGVVDPEVHGLEGPKPLEVGTWVRLVVDDLSMSRVAMVARVQRDGASVRVRFIVRG